MKYYSGILFICSLITMCSSMLGGTPALGKVDDDDDTKNVFEYPFFVVIRTKEITIESPFLNGGIIIRSKWVLTLCTRLTVYPIHYYSVVAGNFSLPGYNRFTQIRKVVNIYCHQDAITPFDTYTHDLALVQVQAPFKTTAYVSTVNIRQTTNKISDAELKCTFIGAGHHNTENWDKKYYKHKTNLTVYTDVSKCNISGNMKKHLLCSIGEGERGYPGALCRGDVSGILYCNEEFVEGMSIQVVNRDAYGEDVCNILHPKQNIVAYLRLDSYNFFDGAYPSDYFPFTSCKRHNAVSAVCTTWLLWPLLGLGLWTGQT